ncbi:MAG TPA: helix-turn-helix domain-containing protein [Candidatus Paceibacterota bacterium]|nr:helix-turn-helix domain-containing protein [Verrucomicrobiota bacterium]HRY51134.1 helix-turn-helix domain-containing protein [Candidatus Paceibacterota bacterium]HSA03552.1 helix-turn-helix domain-containing protein [Candidatus Paceibacterota bacterium]
MAARRAQDLPYAVALGVGDANSGIHPHPDQHPDVELYYGISGRVIYSYCGNELTIPAEQLAVFWAGFPHRIIRAVRATRYYWIHIPLEEFLVWRLPTPFKQSILSGQPLIEPTRCQRSLDRDLFRSWILDTGRRHSSHWRWTLLEIEARLGRMADRADSTALKPPGTPPDHAPGQIPAAARIACFLQQHYGEPIYWKDVAQIAGLSIPSARKCFLQSYGLTLHEYLIQLRVARAKQMIATAEAKIIDVALETGFHTLSNFYRTFEAVVGRTPSGYRKSLSPARAHFGKVHKP